MNPFPARNSEDEARRILQVSWSFFPEVGGIATHIYELSRHLVERGRSVTVLCADRAGELPPREQIDGIDVRRVPAFPRTLDLYFAPDIYRVIATTRWNIIHVQGAHTLVAVAAMLGALRSRQPFVITYHSSKHASELRNALRPLHWRALRPLLRQAAHSIGLSEEEVRYFQRLLHVDAARFSVIPNGCDLPSVASEAIPVERDLVVSVGRLDPLKGHQRLIEAMPRILTARPGARLLIVGAGDYEGALRDQIAALHLQQVVEITSIAPIARAEMARTLKRAGLVALLSRSENNPIAAREAIAAGCSVLVTQVGGLADLARRGLARAIPVDAAADDIARAVVEQLAQPFIPAAVDLTRWSDCVDAVERIYSAVAPTYALRSEARRGSA